MKPVQINLAVVIVLVLVALAFDFMNGFHDAANSIATVVSTRVLKPHQAVLLAAVFNVVALFVFQLKVAATFPTFGATDAAVFSIGSENFVAIARLRSRLARLLSCSLPAPSLILAV